MDENEKPTTEDDLTPEEQVAEDETGTSGEFDDLRDRLERIENALGAIAETLEGLKDAEGNPKVAGIFAAVPYCIDLIGGPYIETHDAVVKAFRPKSAIRPKA